MRVLTILARYGVDQYATAAAEMKALYDAQLSDIDRDLLIVDNALPPDRIEPTNDGRLIGGDNRVREFTAFDRAIAWAGRTLDHYDLVHIATSAFNTLYTGYLQRFTSSVLRLAANRSICLGHIDCYNAPVRLESFVSQHWVRTCFFFLPPSEVRSLGSFVSAANRERFFSGNPEAAFKEDAPLSGNYRQYILEWLTGGDIGQGVRWHSRLELTTETLPAFEQKAMCILNEHLLACRLRAAGCPLVDVTWLSSHLEEARGTSGWPGWGRQLADRDRDRVLVDARAM